MSGNIQAAWDEVDRCVVNRGDPVSGNDLIEVMNAYHGDDNGKLAAVEYELHKWCINGRIDRNLEDALVRAFRAYHATPARKKKPKKREPSSP